MWTRFMCVTKGRQSTVLGGVHATYGVPVYDINTYVFPNGRAVMSRP